jgi:uncharacterized protein (AIM24 family)
MATMRAGKAGAQSDEEFLQALYTGGELLTAGKVIEAKDHLERAYQLQPKNEKSQNLLGLAYFKLGMFDRAAEIYEALVKDNPVDHTLRINLGLVYLKTGALQRAVREFEIAVDLAPEHKKAQNYLGLALAQAGEYGRAKDAFVAAGSEPMVEKMARILSGEEAPPPRNEEASASNGQGGAKLNGHPRHDSALTQQNWSSHADQGQGEEIQVSGDGQGDPPEEDFGNVMIGGEEEAQEGSSPEAAFDSVAPEREPSVKDSLSERMRVPELPPEPKTPVRLVPKPVVAAAAAVNEPVTPPAAIVTPDGFIAPNPHSHTAVSKVGPVPVMELSQLTKASRLGESSMEMPFHVAPDALTMTVGESVRTRLVNLIAATGTLEIGPEMKRFRGRPTDKPFGSAETQLMRVIGRGVLVFHPGKQHWLPIHLGEDSAYFREEVVFSFEESVMFENGRVPSEFAPDLDLVHLRGSGQVLLCLPGPVRSVAVSMERPVTVPAQQLVGWQGSLTPRIVPLVQAPSVGISMAGVQLTGEGVALVTTPLS